MSLDTYSASSSVFPSFTIIFLDLPELYWTLLLAKNILAAIHKSRVRFLLLMAHLQQKYISNDSSLKNSQKFGFPSFTSCCSFQIWSPFSPFQWRISSGFWSPSTFPVPSLLNMMTVPSTANFVCGTYRRMRWSGNMTLLRDQNRRSINTLSICSTTIMTGALEFLIVESVLYPENLQSPTL